MHDRLATLNSIPRLLTTMGSGALGLAGLAAFSGGIQQDFSRNILEVSLTQMDLRVWHVLITFVVLALSIVFGEILSITSSWLRVRLSPTLSEVNLLLLLNETKNDDFRHFLQQRIAVAHLSETLGLSIFLFLVGAFAGSHLHDGVQVKDVELLSLTTTLACLTFLFLLISSVFLHLAVRMVERQPNAG